MKSSLFAKILAFAGLALNACFAVSASVVVERLPGGGMQPSAVTDGQNNVYMAWLGGDPAAADVYYWRLPGGKTEGAKPIRVNSHDGSGIAVGNVRGAHVALGRNGRAYVLWNGSSKAEPKHANSTPLLFSRMNDRGDAFESEQDLIGETCALDGGAAVAADGLGNVFVVWHAIPKPGQTEKDRQVYVAQSSNDGKTFAPPRAVSLVDGVCGCCGLQASTDKAGNLYIAYRAVTDPKQRDIATLVSRDHGKTFSALITDPWRAGGCPMSTAAFVETSRGMLGAWETKGQISGAWLGTESKDEMPVTGLSTTPNSKHPALATNAKGEVLAAWAVGTGWMRGGSVAWQTVDLQGKPVGEPGAAPDLPVWDYPAVFARANGDFVVIY